MRSAVRLVVTLLLLSAPLQVFSAAAAANPAFMAVQASPDSGKVSIEVPAWNQPFLIVATLENALGSNDIGLDRAQNGNPLLVEFRRIGQKAFLVQRNTAFVADSKDPDETKAAKDAFAESVLWSGALQAGSNRVDIGSLLLGDWVGVANRLQATKLGKLILTK